MDKYLSIWMDAHGVRTLMSITDIKAIYKNSPTTITIYYKPNSDTNGTCVCGGGGLLLNLSGTMVVGNQTDVGWLHDHIKNALESPKPVYELPKQMAGVVDNAGNDIKITSTQVL